MTYGLIKKPAVRAMLFALTAFVLFFIFYMSSFNGDDSSELSGGLLSVILSVLSRIGIGEILTEHMLRKIAHFTEYFVLGGLLFLDTAGFGAGVKTCFSVPLGLGLLTAALDELSQFLSEGRTPLLTDVFIDFCGVFAASLVLLILSIIKNGKSLP